MATFSNIDWPWTTNAILQDKKQTYNLTSAKRSIGKFQSPRALLTHELHFKMPAGSQASRERSRINGAVEGKGLLSICPGVKLPPKAQHRFIEHIANVCTPLFGGIPATGAIARTMTNINNGGRTPVSGIIHAAVLLLIFLVLMPLAAYIPMACLAGVLIIVSYNMSGWRTFRALMKNPKSDITVLIITFLLTVIFDLTIAIEVGLVIACLLFMRRMAETTQVKLIADEIDPAEEIDVQLHEEEHLIIPQGVEVYEINGPYFFGIANKFEDLMAGMANHPKVRIIRMRRVPFIDSTGIHNLQTLCAMSRREGTEIVLSGVQEKVYEVLDHAGLCDELGKENICPNINAALERAKEVVE